MSDIWTSERLQQLPLEDLRNLRGNAETRGAKDLVDRCDAALALRRPQHARRLATQPSRASTTGYVAGYHFVCRNDTGVDVIENGWFWTRTWVVAKHVAAESLKFGAYVALHESKDEPSYRQGSIQRIAVGDRFGRTKSLKGIDFLVSPTKEALAWNGDGTGEKGYLWKPIPHTTHLR